MLASYQFLRSTWRANQQSTLAYPARDPAMVPVHTWTPLAYALMTLPEYAPAR